MGLAASERLGPGARIGSMMADPESALMAVPAGAARSESAMVTVVGPGRAASDIFCH